MKTFQWVTVVATMTLLAGTVYAQYPVMEIVAGKVIEKYQASSCEQLWVAKGQAKSEMEQRAIEALKNDAQMREMFFNKVSGPIVNKMFECGMIP